MHYFPICLNITKQHCIVIGGGQVGSRKAHSLLKHGAKVTVISPALTNDLTLLHESGRLSWINRVYQQGDLKSVFLVIAATNDKKVQQAVHAEAVQNNILLNIADVPELCNFILPAIVKRGDLSIAISTGGKSPALAGKLRRQLEQQFGSEYEKLLNLLGRLRIEVLAKGRSSTENKDIFNNLIHPEMIVWIKNNDWQKVEAHLHAVLDSDSSLSVRELI